MTLRGWLPVLAVVAWLGPGCSQRHGAGDKAAAAGPERAVQVEAVKLTVREEQRLLEVTGTLQPDDKVTVSSEVDGALRTVLVDLGDRVSLGQLLAEVNPEEFEIDVRQQRARLQQALANLGLKEGEDPRLKPNEETPEVRVRIAQIEEAQENFRRAELLRKEDIGTAQMVDQAKALLKTAQANYTAAVESIEMQRAQHQQARVALQLAEKKLKDTRILAPFAGSIGERQASVGQYVRALTPLFVIVRTNPLRLRAEVAERLAPIVRVNQIVALRVDSLPGRKFTGRITRISPSVSEQTRTLLVEALVQNDDEALRPGMFVRASIQSGQMTRALMAPARAVVNLYGTDKVFCLVDGKAQERSVKLGDRYGDHFEVLQGVRENELVAMSNLELLSTGRAVEVKRQ